MSSRPFTVTRNEFLTDGELNPRCCTLSHFNGYHGTKTHNYTIWNNTDRFQNDTISIDKNDIYRAFHTERMNRVAGAKNNRIGWPQNGAPKRVSVTLFDR